MLDFRVLDFHTGFNHRLVVLRISRCPVHRHVDIEISCVCLAVTRPQQDECTGMGARLSLNTMTPSADMVCIRQSEQRLINK